MDNQNNVETTYAKWYRFMRRTHIPRLAKEMGIDPEELDRVVNKKGYLNAPPDLSLIEDPDERAHTALLLDSWKSFQQKGVALLEAKKQDPDAFEYNLRPDNEDITDDEREFISIGLVAGEEKFKEESELWNFMTE